MAYVTKQVSNSLSVEDRQKDELLLFNTVVYLAMLIETVFAIGYTYNYAFSSHFNEFFQWVMFVFLGLFSVCLVALQQYSYMKFTRAVVLTKTVKDDWFWGVFTLVISVVIIFIDIKGGKDLINALNGYTPNVKNITNDTDYNKLDSDRKELKIELESAKEEKEKAIANCFECTAIAAKYEAKKKKHKASANPAWVKVENAQIDNANSKIEADKKEAVANKLAEVEKIKLQKIDAIQVKLDQIDNKKRRVEDVITIDNESEKKKGTQKKEENDAAAVFVTPLTQVLMAIMRYIIMKRREKENKDWVEKGIFSFIFNFFAPIVSDIENFFYKREIKSKYDIAASRLKTIDAVKEYKDSFMDDRIDTALLVGSTSELSMIVNLGTGVTITDEDEKKKYDLIEEKSGEKGESSLILDEKGDDFIDSINGVIELLLQLKPLYSEREFSDIQEIINILQNLKNI